MYIIDTTTSLLDCKSLELSLLELIKSRLTENSCISILNNKEIMDELDIDEEQSGIFLKNYNTLLSMAFKVFHNEGMRVINLFEMINCSSVFLPVDNNSDDNTPVETEKTNSYEYCLTKHGANILKGTNLAAIDNLNKLELSIHSKKLFMLVQQQNPVVVTIEQIRNILDIETTYKNLTNFKGLIKKSAEQIIDQTNEAFEYGFLEFDGSLLGLVLQIKNSDSIDLSKQWNYEEITKYIGSSKPHSIISRLPYHTPDSVVDDNSKNEQDETVNLDAPHLVINIPMIDDNKGLHGDKNTESLVNIIDHDDVVINNSTETSNAELTQSEATIMQQQGYTNQYDYHPSGLFVNPINPVKDEDLVEIDLAPLSDVEIANLFDGNVAKTPNHLTSNNTNEVLTATNSVVTHEDIPSDLITSDENDDQKIIDQFFSDTIEAIPPNDRHYDYNEKTYTAATEITSIHVLDELYSEMLVTGDVMTTSVDKAMPELIDDGSIMFIDENKQQEIDEINSLYYAHCQAAGIEHTQQKYPISDEQLQNEATIWEMIQNSMQ